MGGRFVCMIADLIRQTVYGGGNRMKMKKAVAAVLSAVMMILTGTAAPAENAAGPFCDAAMQLLFETGNVTLTGEAEFFLDGERFKTAEMNHIQDGENSLYRLALRTPRRDGSGGPDRESGYTIIANGEKVYVMEVFYPGLYKTGTTGLQTSVLRRSVHMDLMKELLKVLSDQAETLAGVNAVTVTRDEKGGQELRIELGEEVPEMVNTALSMFFQFAAKRWFNTDYDYVNEREMPLMDDCLTVAQGILDTMKSVSLKKAVLSVRLDGDGRLVQAEGNVSLNLYTARDGIRQLDITFSLNTSDWGVSRVNRFSPADYGVTLMEGAMDVDALEMQP